MNIDQVFQGDWHPAQVKAALEMAGTNLSQLARQHKYKHINEVLHRPWVAAELIVAKALKKKPEEIWPSRYSRPRDRARAMTRNPQMLRANKAFGSAYAKSAEDRTK